MRTLTMEIKRIPIQVGRTPIMVGRTPITGIRKPIIEGGYQELDWDDIYKSLVNYIKFAAKQVAEQYQTGICASAEDLFQEGQLLLYHCYNLYKYKPLNQFQALFKASLWRKLRGLASKKEFIQVDITDAYDIGYSETVVESMYEEFKLQQVVEILGADEVAITILKEMISPSNRTIWEAKMDVARKQMLKNQDYKITVPQSVTVKGIHIQRAMEITKTEYKKTLNTIRQVVSMVYDREENGGNYTDDDEEWLEELKESLCG